MLRSKIIFLFILLTVFLPFFAQGQDPYYFFYTTGQDAQGNNELQPISFPQGTLFFNSVVTWDYFRANQIPIYNQLENTTYPNDQIFYSQDMLNEFTTAMQEWENHSSFGFSESYSSFNSVGVYWITSPNSYPGDAVNGQGVTPLAIDIDKIVPVANFGSESQYSYSVIYLNNCSIRDFEWTTNYIAPQWYLDEYNVVNFQNVALHELGHLLGLSHNYYDPNSVMHYPMYYDEITQMVLESSDINNINKLAEITGFPPTGIEDAIQITEALSNYDVNHLYVGYIDRTFIDVYPYGDYITSWDNWKITASYGCGEVTLYDSPYSDI